MVDILLELNVLGVLEWVRPLPGAGNEIVYGLKEALVEESLGEIKRQVQPASARKFRKVSVPGQIFRLGVGQGSERNRQVQFCF